MNAVRLPRDCQPRTTGRHRHSLQGPIVPRSGFTLLEVMLSLTLAVVLLGAVYSAMSQSWRLTASGREEMARSQLARALLSKLSLDIRAVMFVPPPPSDGESDTDPFSSVISTAGADASAGTGSTTDGSTSGSTGSTATADTSAADSTGESEPSPTSIGIRGTLTRLELHISRARRDLNFAAGVEGTQVSSRTSDLLAVTYSLAVSGGGGTLGTGLIRSEGDRLIVQAVEETGGNSVQASRSQALAPEVVALAFRYFDGTTWYETWDSTTNGYLPRAIEVTLGFAPPALSGGPLKNVVVSSSVNQFRMVIAVPVADPLPPEMVP